MTREPSNAVNEPGLRKLLAKGWHIVVLCTETPEFRNKQCFGEWAVRVMQPDGGEERPLVLSRAPYDERRFSTLNTVAKFLDKYGVATSHIPLRVGGRSVNVPPAPWARD